MDFRTDVSLGLPSPLMPPLMNGGGCIKTIQQVREAAKSLSGAVLIGSFTIEPRDGNPGDVFWVGGQHGTLNSLGMPNGGRVYLEKNLKAMVQICHDAGKPLIVNVAGFTPEEYGSLAQLAFYYGADAVELNLGCPNVVQGNGDRKPVPSYDTDTFRKIILQMMLLLHPDSVVWVKVSPNFNGDQIKALARILQMCPNIKALTASNTLPNCYAVDENGKPKITVGLAGLSGPPLKHIGLGQVLQWQQALSRGIEIIASGGITAGEDLRDYGLVGASAFQVTTELLRRGDLNLSIFDNLAVDYDSL